MVTLDDYNDDSIAACRSVLVEAFTVLGRHRGHLVLVGGWVPPLLMPGAGHIGSIDVDLAIDSRQIPPHLYETIGNDLRRAGLRAPGPRCRSLYQATACISARRNESLRGSTQTP